MDNDFNLVVGDDALKADSKVFIGRNVSENTVVLLMTFTDPVDDRVRKIGLALTPKDAIDLGNDIHARAFDTIINERAKSKELKGGENGKDQ